MRRYYVISPNVWNDNDYDHLLEDMIKNHFVLMGWSVTDENGNTKTRGRMFADLDIGDCVIVAKRTNWVWNYCFMGTICSDVTEYMGAQCRGIDNFIDLRNKELSLLDEWSTNGSKQMSAIAEIKTYKNKEIIKKIDNIIYSNEKAERMTNYLNLLKNTKNLILTGAPGTGKTYLAKQIAKEMVGEGHNANIYFTQFHQSYDYTDFVEGLRPIPVESSDGKIGFKRVDGTFKSFCSNALQNLLGYKLDDLETEITNEFNSLCDDITSGKEKEVTLKGNERINENKVERQNFVFIIDEINRGEMSKIFGELFYAIDPTCRITEENLKNKDFEAITTQYANMNTEPNIFDECLGIGTDNNTNWGHFFVPENVYVIGTMNDIDRGVESIDFAFRRRFAWEEVKAKDTQNEILNSIITVDDKKISKENLVTVMDALNNAIWNENEQMGIEGLSSAYHLGAAYFLKINDYSEDESPYTKLWDYNLKPLLKEYLRGMDSAEEALKNLQGTYNTAVSNL